MGGSPAISAWIIQRVYSKFGVQMQVSKEVSNDLLATDFDITSKIEDIPFAAPAVEVYFEDPLLPTILVMKCRPENLIKWFPQITIQLENVEYITALIQEGSDIMSGQWLSLQIKPSMYSEFLNEGKADPMKCGLFSYPLSQTDNNVMCYMLHLALKVFVFSSIPQFKPINLSRKQMHFGGKPGVKGRPERQSLGVSYDYLPKVIYSKISQPTGISKDFKGRRGHIRCLSHERFTKLKGSWIYIKPVRNPHDGKFSEANPIRVRKPTN
jgi:hypothetical protein